MSRTRHHGSKVVVALAAAVLAIAHCTGGQSGHEGATKEPPTIGGPISDVRDAGFGNCGHGNCPGDIWLISPCICEAFVGRIALRGVVSGFSQTEVELQIRHVVGGPGCGEANGDAGSSCGFAVDDTLRAAWDGELPCAKLCAEIEAGEDVFALYDPTSERVALIRARDPDFGDALDLGDGRVFDEDLALLLEGGAACEEAVISASGGASFDPAPNAETADPSPAEASNNGDDAASDQCPLVEVHIDAGRSPLTRPPFHGHAELCAAAAPADAPIDCLDVCGVLAHCPAQIACDECMSRCLASPETRQDFRCLSYAIYSIDEEGCDRMVEQYRAFADGYECPPPG
jgi:hypothetical protein